MGRVNRKPKRITNVILVVDDEEIIRGFFLRAFREYRIITAANGEEALCAIKKEKPDLVLLDIRLPGMDGIEVLKRIKEDCPDIVVIMLSAHCTFKNKEEAARLGAYAMVSKPFELDEMKSMLKNAFLYIAQARGAEES